MLKRWHVVKRLLPLLAGFALLLSGCGRDDLSTLRPQGPVAEEQFGLMKLSISIMILVVVVVFAIAIYVLLRFRRRPGDKVPVQVEGNHKLEIIWTVIPLVLLVILGVPTIQSVFGLAKDYTHDENAVQVKVTSHQYWWSFEYPQYGVITSQELIVPKGKTVSITAETADVLHSFWIPSLAGKVDTNPSGSVNTMYFSAPKEGVYQGKCAELCGPSHALMDFKVKVVSDDSFENWVAAEKAPATTISDPAIAETFKNKCLSCHAIGDQGTPGAFPNLTGIGGKIAIAGILLNSDDPQYENEGSAEENLKKWITDPQQVKPGAHMPSAADQKLTAEEVDAIAKYLASQKIQY